LLKLYLDTGAILKRYIIESGTNEIDLIFDKAEIGELTIITSLWNIGEALGVLDEKLRRGWLTEREFQQTMNLFADELLKLMRLKRLEITPVDTPTLTNTWNLILNYHSYEADALQMTTCNFGENTALITIDKKLAQTSKKIGIPTILLPGDEEVLKALI